MYERETVEYHPEHMQKYSKDLNTTLISTRSRYTVLATSLGWPVLRGQLRLRHRHPEKGPTRLRRTVEDAYN